MVAKPSSLALYSEAHSPSSHHVVSTLDLCVAHVPAASHAGNRATPLGIGRCGRLVLASRLESPSWLGGSFPSRMQGFSRY